MIGSSSRRSSAIAVARQRMAPAGFRVAPQQHRLVGVQVDDLAGDTAAPEVPHLVRHAQDLAGLVARVEPDRRAPVALVAAADRVRDEGAEQPGRDVVDAVPAQILERVQRHALAGAGQATDDDQAHGRHADVPGVGRRWGDVKRRA
jgi:hypothetical protein